MHNGSHTQANSEQAHNANIMRRLIPESVAGKAATLGFGTALVLGTAACSHESAPEASPTAIETVAPSETAEPTPTITVAPSETAEPTPTAEVEVNDPSVVESFIAKYDTMTPEEFAATSAEERVAYQYLKYNDDLIEAGNTFFHYTGDKRDKYPKNLSVDSPTQDILSAFKVRRAYTLGILESDNIHIDADAAKKFYSTSQLVPAESTEYATMIDTINSYDERGYGYFIESQALNDNFSWDGFSFTDNPNEMANAPGDGLDKELTYRKISLHGPDGDKDTIAYWIDGFTTTEGLQIPGTWVMEF